MPYYEQCFSFLDDDILQLFAEKEVLKNNTKEYDKDRLEKSKAEP